MDHTFSETRYSSKNGQGLNNESAETSHPPNVVKDASKQEPHALDHIVQGHREDCSVGKHDGEKSSKFVNPSGEVNMEATITSEDVIRAGGFGARDDLSSFLPVASDSTDFEASLLDARDYEEPQGKPKRPGLGWTDALAP